MFGDHFAPAKQLLAIVQSVVGPTRELTDVLDARSRGRWEHGGQYRGRPLRILLLHRHASGATGQLAGVELGAPLGGRPLEAWLDLAPPAQSQTGLPNGETSVLPHVEVYGFPVDVMRSVLDPATVAAMRANATASRVEALTTEGDWLCAFLRVDGEMPDAAAISRVLDLLCGAADRFAGAFDHLHTEAQRVGGPAAAAQWLASQRAGAHIRREKRQRSRMIAIGIAIVVMFVIVSVIIALAVLVRC